MFLSSPALKKNHTHTPVKTNTLLCTLVGIRQRDTWPPNFLSSERSQGFYRGAGKVDLPLSSDAHSKGMKTSESVLKTSWREGWKEVMANLPWSLKSFERKNNELYTKQTDQDAWSPSGQGAEKAAMSEISGSCTTLSEYGLVLPIGLWTWRDQARGNGFAKRHIYPLLQALVNLPCIRYSCCCLTGKEIFLIPYLALSPGLL